MLEEKTHLMQADHKLMDDIYHTLTNILVWANQKCQKFNKYPWSPLLHKAYLVHHYWKLKQSVVATKRNYDKTYQCIQAIVSNEALVQAPSETISVKIWQARNNLHAISCDVVNKWKQFPNDLGLVAKHTKNKNQQKLILGLKQAEENRQCFAMVRHQRPEYCKKFLKYFNRIL